MSNPKILSGYDIVEKHFAKNVVSLPELDLKDVISNGTWLEEKQIQSALEARKQLVEVERIEKRGVLSVAIWKEKLMLAEVKHKVGGYWQYMGHNVGNQLFLHPEEALFLMEVNCLQLFHNDIKVSLQQAYTLLLRGKVTILQYKVYASLSRLGYRIFRHEKKELTDYEKKIKLPPNIKKNIFRKLKKSVTSEDETEKQEILENNQNCEVQEKTATEETNIDCGSGSLDKSFQDIKDTSSDYGMVEAHEASTSTINKRKSSLYYQKKVKRIKYRKLKPCRNDVVHKYFDDMPSLSGKETVTIKIPEKQYIPKNINLNRTTYNINLENLQKKMASPSSSDSNIYSGNDEANGVHVRRLRNTSINFQQLNNINIIPTPTMSYATQNMHFRFFQIWRPQTFNCNFNMLFQRPYLQRRFMPHFGTQYNQPLDIPIRTQFSNQTFPGNQFVNYNSNQINDNIHTRYRKNHGNAKNHHLEGIKRSAARLKQLSISGNINNEYVRSLERLIHTYNIRYKTKLTLTRNFDILTNENIVETIELEGDNEPRRKKRKTAHTDQNFDHSLNLLKNLATQLKELEKNARSTPKHRRAFNKVLRSFNDTYNVEYYVNNNFAVINSRHINIASTSDSDCKAEEEPPYTPSNKKLKNPFNIIKRLAETQSVLNHEQSDQVSEDIKTTTDANKHYSQLTIEAFPNQWLPPEDDFGRAEVSKVYQANDNFSDTRHEEFLYDFLRVQQNKFSNWIDLKLSFFGGLEKAVEEFQTISSKAEFTFISPPKSEACSDMDSVLRKLRFIKSATIVDQKTNLSIDFDVYNRNVQNFKKSKPPAPHFRMICLDETSPVPCGAEVAALKAEYDDNVSLVFAIVGHASVSSYIQINPTDIPVYTSNTKM